MGFYPENNRVEFQGIGRAGRQGQIGSAQVIFSKDEMFFKTININSAKDAELFRKSKLKEESNLRVISSLFEINIYQTLKLFFKKLSELKKLFEDENFKIIFNNICLKEKINYNTATKQIIENFKVDWAEYFDKISERNTNIKSSFDDFLEKYDWKNIDIKNNSKWKKLILNKINKL